MKQLMRVFVILGLLILTTSPIIKANSLNGGRGLIYIHSAWAMKPGHLTLYGHTRFFGKVGQTGTVENISAVTYWDVQGSLSLNYGISEHFELAITPIMYQDNHKGGKGYNLPDDLFLRLKIGSFGARGSSLSYGVLLNSRFPTAKKHNLVFEPYSAGTVEWGFMGLISYSRDPLYPEDALNVHFNLGYINHNDVGANLTPDHKNSPKVLHMTQELLYGLGIKIPSNQFDFSVELYGNAFLQKPPEETAYSCENYLYLTPGLIYKAYKWLTLHFGTDFLISPNHDNTKYLYGGKIEDMPNYPTWRVNLGLKFVLLPTSVYKVSERDILMRKAQSRRELFEQIIKEQRETESAEEELERIKEERRKAEKELERLRKILEGEAKGKKEEPPPQQEPK